MNFDSTAVAGRLMTLHARAKEQCASSNRPRLAPTVRIQHARGDFWEKAAWAVLALAAFVALAVGFAI